MGKRDEERKKRSRLRHWLSSRFGFEAIEENFLYRRVTKTPSYYGGGATLMLLFGVLVITGAFLALDYSASPATAYDSVLRITLKNRFGWFVRALHYWTAGVMVVILVYHMFRQILLGGYLSPREGTWLIGIVMFGLVITNSFTGYTLRWDEEAIYAIRLVLHMLYTVPFIGEDLVVFVQGGWYPGANLLSRLYAVHVIFVPLSLSALIAYHLYLVTVHGVTTLYERGHDLHIESAEEQQKLRDRLKKSEDQGEDFYPWTAGRSAGFALVVFLAILLLAVVLGTPQKLPEANLTTTSMPEEEWWFHWYSGLLALLPPWLAPYFHIGFPVLAVLLLIALPFMDRHHNRGLRRRPLAAAFVVSATVALFALTSLRLQSPWTAWPRSEAPPIPRDAKLEPSAQAGRILFTRYGCYSCHSVGGHGAKVGPNLSGLHARLSKEELTQYVLQPPEGVPMPAYRGRITDEDLAKVVDFVLVAQTFPREYEVEKR